MSRPALSLPRPAPGWTLLEVAVVLAMVALLCGLALPTLNGMVVRMRADMLRMQMVSAFNMARNTAITRFQPVAVCPSADGRQCGDDWSRGWLIHRDRGPGPPDLQDGDILRFQPGSQARAVQARASQGRPRLRFQADGRSGGSTLTVDICAGELLHSQVIVNNVGRTRALRVRETVACPH